MKPSLTETFDIEFPLFAFSHCRDVVAAVSRNGGFGVLGTRSWAVDTLSINKDLPSLCVFQPRQQHQ